MRSASSRRAAGIVVAALCCALLGASTALAAPHAPATPRQPVASRQPAASLSTLEQGVLDAVNAFRTQNHLVPLHLSETLTSAARAHTQEMAVDGYFAHESADGTAFWQRIQHFYPSSASRYWSVGENLLWSSPDVDPQGALQLWLASPEHRANLLTARWREIGVAAVHVPAASGTYRGADVTIVTTDFGVRR
jgi:uncharacterized protein YkwD